MSDASIPLSEYPNPYAPPATLDLLSEGRFSTEMALEYVGFWRRAAARLLDLGLHMVLGGCVGLGVGIGIGLYSALRGVPFELLIAQAEPSTWMSWVSGMIAAMLFQVIAEGWHGSSPGKRLLGIVVLQENGRPCAPRQALLREIAYFVDALFFGAVAAVRMSESDREQRIGDSWAKTVVVYRRSAPAQSLRSGLRLVGVSLVASVVAMTVLALPFIIRLSAN